MSPPELPAVPDSSAPQPRPGSRKILVIAAITVAAAALSTVAVGWVGRAPAASSISAASATSATPPASGDRTLIAKATGYVTGLRVDLGQRVAAGETLMTIQAPELLEELQLARARLTEAEQNAKLAATSAARTDQLVEVGGASAQERDDGQARLNSAQAAVATGKAEVERLRALVGYQRIAAPFAGTVVRRLVDPGALAQAGQTALVELAATDQLDIEVDVPQQLAAGVTPGLPVEVSSRDRPGAALRAQVTRTSGVLHPTTRTMRIEVRISGSSGILPSSYVTVAIESTRAAPPLLAPASAVAATADGTIVATVVTAGPNSVVAIRRVKVLRDLGKELEIEAADAEAGTSAGAGLDEGAPLILNLPADLRDGEAVQLSDPSRGSAPAARSPG